jgi:hypothetical protein
MSSANRTIKGCQKSTGATTYETQSRSAPNTPSAAISTTTNGNGSSSSSSSRSGSSPRSTSREARSSSRPSPVAGYQDGSSTGNAQQKKAGAQNGSSAPSLRSTPDTEVERLRERGLPSSLSTIDPSRLSQSGLWTLRQVTFRIYLGWTEAEIAGYFGESTKWVRQRRARLREELSA